jgi:hypothetical protein
MKKSLIDIIKLSCVIVSITACSNPTNNNLASSPSPVSSSSSTPQPSISNTPSMGSITKESVIAVYNCVKAKSPELSAVMDSYIVSVNVQTDDKWLINSGPTKDGLKRLETYGCFYK